MNLGTQVTQSAKMLRRLIGEDIRLDLRSAEDTTLTVLVDPSQLEQVMLNLAVNARDAMPGGGTLTIATGHAVLGDAEAADEGVKPGHFVSLSVSDTGTGMTPEVRERIFEPFFTTKGQGKGTGLGLATVYGVVHQSGGTIQVTSEVGKGSTFRVLMPRVTTGVEAGAATETQRSVGSETILLVEDESALRDMTARMLEAAGYRVVTAQSGTDAIDLLREYPETALVITDVVMPGMSGSELAQEVSARRPNLHVLFVSGYTDDKLGSVLTSHGANFLAKPFTVAALTRKVRQVIDGY